MSTSIPPPPKQSGSGPFLLAAIAMLLLMGGLIFWKFRDSEPPAPPPPPVTTQTAPPPVMDEPPPPPPPPPEPEAPQAAAPEKPVVKRSSVGSQGCAGTCEGQVSSTLRSQLGARAAGARPCYERALRQNAHLQGRMSLSLRIGPTGNVCSANISSNELGDPGIASCVVQMFRGTNFAAPEGGCVDVVVPMNFEPKT